MNTNQFHALTESDLEALKREGIIKKERFFSTERVNEIAETTIRLRENALPHRKPSRKWILTSPFHALKRSIRHQTRNDLKYLSDVALQCEFRRFSSLYFGEPVRLSHIMSIESPVLDEPITCWHADANTVPPNVPLPPNRFTLKFFIYLNDIDSTNGAFAYIPQSHRLVVAIRECIYNRAIPFHETSEVDELRAACSSPQVLNAVLKMIPQQDIDDFLSATETLIGETEATHEHDLIGPAGTLLIFDDRGLHRGGIPKSSSRSILRYNYLPTPYWNETLSPIRYLLYVASRALLPRSVAAHW